MRSHPHPRPLMRRRALVAISVLTLIGAACGSADDDDAQADGVASLRDASGDAETDATDGATTGGATTDDATTDDATTDDATTDAESSELEAPEDPEEAFALYDQCLQDHGVDPGEGFAVAGEGDAIAVAPAEGAAPNGAEADGDGPDNQVFVFGEGPNGEQPPEIDEEMLAAMEACRGHLANATPDFDLTPEQQAAMEDAQLAFQQCMEEHGIEGGGFTISIGDGAALDVDEQQDDQAAPPPAEVDPEQFQAAAEACQSVYDDYPELDDVFPDGGPMGGVAVGSAETPTGS